MKFTDGYWCVRDGIQANYAAQALELEQGDGTLTVYAPVRVYKHRGDTLNAPLLKVTYSSPMKNVLKVRVAHHEGGLDRGPHFPLNAEKGFKPAIVIGDDEATVTTGDLSVHIPRGEYWRVSYMAGGKVITKSDSRSTGYMIDAKNGPFMKDELALGVGEYAYGLGERYTAFVKNGQSVDIWNADGGTATEQTYKNVPFYMTNRGYGVFVNDSGKVAFEVGSEKVSRVQFSVPGEELEYFIVYGPDPKAILERYTALTGRPALPPKWTFGLWLTTSFTTSYDEQTVMSFIDGMAERKIPLSVFHFDCFWMKEFHWCDFQWDRRVFPDPVAMLARLKARGLRICVWINPYIAQRSPLFDEGMVEGYLVKTPGGDIWQWDKWQSGMGLVDFTNPRACRWYADKLRALLDMGVDCFKTDFGERIPTDVVWYDGSDPIKMHNYYSYLYNKTVFELLQAERGVGEAAVFARSATTGGQQFPVHWGGDSTATFESMAESLRGGLSLGLSGFGFWSHDIGGFEQTASADVYKRWCAFGLLSSHSRLHGSSSYRVPWLFDEEAVDVLRHFTKLKCRLMPYLFGQAVRAHMTGAPVLRAMVLEFPDDPACDMLDRQYMLGDALLVAPVFTADGTVSYYLPPGRWTHFLTGAVVEGGRWQRETHDYLSLPLMVRPNSVIPVGADDARPDYDYADGVTFHVFALDDGATAVATVPDAQGREVLRMEVTRAGDTVTARTTGAQKPWRLLLRGLPGGDVLSEMTTGAEVRVRAANV